MNLPYIAQIGMALSCKNQNLAEEIAQKSLQDISKKIMDGVVYQYDPLDLPIVIATLKITAAGLENILDDDDKEIERTLVESTACVTINAAQIRKMKKEEDQNGSNQ